jgi:hypothetical protein
MAKSAEEITLVIPGRRGATNPESRTMNLRSRFPDVLLHI